MQTVNSDQTGQIPRQTWVFAGRTCNFVGFVMRRLISVLSTVNRSKTIPVLFRCKKRLQAWFFSSFMALQEYLGRVKQIWFLSPMRAAKVQVSLHIRAVSPEPSLLAHTSSESRGTFRQKARSLAPLNGWACAVKICHDGMLEDTNSLDAVHFTFFEPTNHLRWTDNRKLPRKFKQNMVGALVPPPPRLRPLLGGYKCIFKG